ncbi:helix-turn-helix transcriptional regulator [Actinoplanes solisilvae]|uniref:helix-turn-helix transcriptional regulator n=1 Tax=Actinoplanes solisilvae TaxID=2486853 RepID=UPI0013E33832|nr:helix-turn-helix transcriptional regulator [Actinoplanes solisilvae]
MVARKNTELGDFLRARRAALTPAETSVPVVPSARRVPGLRREEVALLAGMSVKYYTRIEQGENHQMSDAVLNSIADALRLDETERRHLGRLANPSGRRAVGPEAVRPSLRSLVEADTERMAYIVGRRFDLLAGNRVAYTLHGLEQGQPVNLARRLFLDPAARATHTDWEKAARNTTAYLRLAVGNFPDDTELAELIDELRAGSADFGRLWAAQTVDECTEAVVGYRHPLVGELLLTVEALNVPDATGQQVVFLTGADAASQKGLRRLANL